MAVTDSGRKLSALIKKAIDDHKLTTAEYEQILHMADADGHIDVHEKSLLKQLHDMLANGTVKKVAR
jgi:hypothetical protein